MYGSGSNGIDREEIKEGHRQKLKFQTEVGSVLTFTTVSFTAHPASRSRTINKASNEGNNADKRAWL